MLTITGEISREPMGRKENRCVPTEAITAFRSTIEEENRCVPTGAITAFMSTVEEEHTPNIWRDESRELIVVCACSNTQLPLT